MKTVWNGGPCLECAAVLYRSGTVPVPAGARPHYARGVCKPCYKRKFYKPVKDRTPRVIWTGKPCVDCGQTLRARMERAEVVPGTVLHKAGGRCGACWARRYGNGKRKNRSHCVTCQAQLSAINQSLVSAKRGRLECNACYFAYLLEELDFFLNTIGYPVRKIAGRLGYADEPHFGRLMRKYADSGSAVAAEYIRRLQAAQAWNSGGGFVSDKERNLKNAKRRKAA